MMYNNGSISLVDLSWTTVIANLYLLCHCSLHVHLTGFALFMLFLHTATIHVFQAVSTGLLLKTKLYYVMPMFEPS